MFRTLVKWAKKKCHWFKPVPSSNKFYQLSKLGERIVLWLTTRSFFFVCVFRETFCSWFKVNDSRVVSQKVGCLFIFSNSRNKRTQYIFYHRRSKTLENSYSLVVCYSISILVGYQMPNTVYTYIYTHMHTCVCARVICERIVR